MCDNDDNVDGKGKRRFEEKDFLSLSSLRWGTNEAVHEVDDVGVASSMKECLDFSECD